MLSSIGYPESSTNCLMATHSRKTVILLDNYIVFNSNLLPAGFEGRERIDDEFPGRLFKIHGTDTSLCSPL
jgi:hypothetical protein